MALVLSACALLPVAGCAERTPDDKTVQVHEYTVRAEVRALPDPARPMSEFIAHHEQIPQFVGPGGTLGMKSMTMPFPVEKGLDLSGLHVGDKIELTFRVDYDPVEQKPVWYRMTAFRVLDPSTRLEFEHTEQSED